MKKSKSQSHFESLRPEGRLGDKGIEEQYYNQMVGIVRALNEVFNGSGPKEIGFVLMVFKYGDGPGRCNYMSNGADRKDVMTLMKEMLARFEGQPEAKGHA